MLTIVGRGVFNDEIVGALSISVMTVKTHIGNLPGQAPRPRPRAPAHRRLRKRSGSARLNPQARLSPYSLRAATPLADRG